MPISLVFFLLLINNWLKRNMYQDTSKIKHLSQCSYRAHINTTSPRQKKMYPKVYPHKFSINHIFPTSCQHTPQIIQSFTTLCLLYLLPFFANSQLKNCECYSLLIEEYKEILKTSIVNSLYKRLKIDQFFFAIIFWYFFTYETGWAL